MRRHPNASRRTTSVGRRQVRLSRPIGRLGVALAAALTLALAAGVTLAAAVAPTVTIDNATAVSYTSAHGTGKVDPQGQATTYRFQYLNDAQLQENLANQVAEWEFAETAKEETIEGAEQSVEADLANLRPGTTYHLRLSAENGDGSSEAVAASTFTTDATVPPSLTIGPPANVTGTTADLSGTIDPEAPPGNPPAFDTSWRFECNPGCNSAGGMIAADSGTHPVSETLTGLEPNTTYEITLFAFNLGSEETVGPVTLTTEGVGPAVQTLYAGQVQTDSAVLAGQINPENSATTYQFEWGTTTGYGKAAPVAAQSLDATDRSFHTVTAPISGLAAGATYHFRIVATNSETGETSRGEDHSFTTMREAVAAAPCPNADFRVGKSQELPDCRAYEQITPPDKEYGLLDVESPNPFIAQAAVEDGRVVYGTVGPLPGSAAGTMQNVYLSNRGAGGWSRQPLTPPQTFIPGVSGGSNFTGFSPDLRFTAVTGEEPPLAPGAAPGVSNLFLRDNASDGYRLLTLSQSLYQNDQRTAVDVAGISSDGSHVAFGWGPHGDIYQWVDGNFSRVGEAEVPASFGNFQSTRWFHGISEDGRRLAYVARREIFVSENGTRTIEASGSQRSVPDPSAAMPFYWGSSSDGSTVLFSSATALTNDAVIGGGEQLYAFDVDTEELSDLDADATHVDPEGARVLGVVGQSEDAGYVYFVARGDLGGGAQSGAPNLYLWHDGTVGFIATLSELDSGNWEREVNLLTSRVSPDGRHLLLTSQARLTAYDNQDQVTEQADPEIYQYDVESDQLTCASCRLDGKAPTGGSQIQPSSFAQLQRQRYFQRYMSDDGSRVVWATREAVLPRDVNGKLDVYEYSGGKVSLLSTGTGEFSTRFGDMSADGNDVYLGTLDHLVRGDSDGVADLFDARVGGGLPEPTGGRAPCSGGECARDASTPPGLTAIGSSNLRGKGNEQAARRCGKRKHLVRRHGKKVCVKKIHKHRKHKPGKRNPDKQPRGARSARGGTK